MLPMSNVLYVARARASQCSRWVRYYIVRSSLSQNNVLSGVVQPPKNTNGLRPTRVKSHVETSLPSLTDGPARSETVTDGPLATGNAEGIELMVS